VLAARPQVARGVLARARGLLGRAGLPPGEALVLAPCGSIHMLGMRFPIDALFLDREGRCLAVARNLRPWRLGPFVRGARAVVELPAGAAGPTQPGDRIRWS
jgi:uncharacterized membrane protein (UPF0127 family)